MIDGFVLSHRLALLDSHRVLAETYVFETLLTTLWNTQFPTIPEHVFRQTREAHLQTMGVELHLAEQLDKFTKSQKMIERRLFEIVLLYKLNCYHKVLESKDKTHHRAVTITGAMLQNRLALLLLDIDERQYELVFSIGKQNGQMNSEWYGQFLGACGLVRVIRALSVISGVKIYLSNVLDDVDFGIDLFAFRGHRDWAISVKTEKTSSLMTISSFKFKPLERGKEQAIFDGAKLAQAHYDIPFLPSLVIVGRNGTRPFDLTLHQEDVEACQRSF